MTTPEHTRSQPRWNGLSSGGEDAASRYRTTMGGAATLSRSLLPKRKASARRAGIADATMRSILLASDRFSTRKRRPVSQTPSCGQTRLLVKSPTFVTVY